MSIKAFNSIGGFSVGDETVSNIILANGDIITNNISVSNIANLGNVGNVIILGGTDGYVLSTDGTGNLNWITQSSGGTLSVSEANANAGNISNSTANVTGLLFDRDSGFSVSNVGNGNVLVQLGSTFKTWVVTGQPNLVAQGEDTVEFIAGNNITITTSNTASPYKYIQFDAEFSDLSNGTSNISIPTANGNIEFSVDGNANVFTVTSTGIITGNGSGGNITGANLISANTVNVATALNVSGLSNLGPVSNVTITGGSNGQYLSTDGSGSLSWVTGSGGGGGTSISNGTSNVNIPTADGNIEFAVDGNANVLIVTSSGIVTGNGSGGNITGANVITANTFISGNGSGGNITGANLISANNINVSSTLTITGTTNLGPVSNVTITGGSNGQYLSTDGSGSLSWVTGSSGGSNSSISNGTSNVNIPTADGNINFSASGNANIVIVTGTGANIVGTLNVTGNTIVGNLTSSAILANSIITNRSNVPVTVNTVIDEFASSSYRTAKYLISAAGDDGYQSLETLIVHDDSNAYITVYASLCSNSSADIIELSSNIVSGNVKIYASSNSANAVVKVLPSYIEI